MGSRKSRMVRYGKWGVGRGSHEGTKAPRRWRGSWVVVETGELGSLPHLGWGNCEEDVRL